MTVQEIVNSIDLLSTEEREHLFELIRQRRIEEREVEILASRQELKQAIADGTAKKRDVRDLIAELLGDDDAKNSKIEVRNVGCSNSIIYILKLFDKSDRFIAPC